MIQFQQKNQLFQTVSEALLPYVQKPGQYIGQEVNQLVRPGDWDEASLRLVIAFPDSYTIGMSHLGCQILYWLANHMEGVCAERTYCPWLDAEQVMRDKRIPLFTWDTRRPVHDADILAISLQYEMGFTNVLTMLDLAGIPLHTKDRNEGHPLVIAGGPQADNPEPMADFFDLVVIGDGENSMTAIIQTAQELKRAAATRQDMIREFARRFEWIYAPSLYDVSYHPDGTLREMTPNTPEIPSTIHRCQTPLFEDAPFPTRPLVPYVETIHDRISIEIMRGCPQRCRFCHAGYTKRPLRLRSVDNILEIARQSMRSTGISELGLLSLSTADYPHLKELASRINSEFCHEMVNISVPSLRVDKMLENIPWMVNAVRKSGLTIAVEAAGDQLRSAIRKKVSDGHLLDGVRQAYQAGWNSVKLYFMAGFPGETPKDIEEIWHLSNRISNERRTLGKGPARVNASVGWLVPKPYTPFQWAAQPTADYFEQVRRQLVSLSRSSRSAVRIKTHNVSRSILEGVFSRGDRKLAQTIEHAWRLGARFDGWDETYNPRYWDEAFAATGIDPAWYAHRERGYNELLPWAHISGGPRTEYLEKQYDDVFTRIGQSKPLPVLV